jgi:hypothetical protein
VAALHDMDRHPGKEEAGFSWHGVSRTRWRLRKVS